MWGKLRRRHPKPGSEAVASEAAQGSCVQCRTWSQQNLQRRQNRREGASRLATDSQDQSAHGPVRSHSYSTCLNRQKKLVDGSDGENQDLIPSYEGSVSPDIPNVRGFLQALAPTIAIS